MSFRRRLVLFLVVTLVVVQALTAMFAYYYLRASLIDKAKAELAVASGVFMRQLRLFSEGVADDVKVLSLDYALRQAIAQRDYGTEISALRNHGRRVGAARMMLIDLDGKVTADTGAGASSGKAFADPDLLNAAAQADEGTAIATLSGRIYWIVVVPVRAPVPIAFIAAFIPVDNGLLEKLLKISSVPHALALATKAPDGGWTIAARTASGPSFPGLEGKANDVLALPALLADRGREYLMTKTRLRTASSSAPVAAILGYPLDDALAPYWSMAWPMLAVLALALLAALLGAMLIVRSFARPLEALADTARRIAAGDYAPAPRLAQNDELGQLAEAFDTMKRAIAEREAALTSAIGAADIARNEAERANLAKSHFLANMSHELRTPLNAITGFAEMLRQQVLGPIGVARYSEYARDICESAEHLLGLVSRMLDLSEAEGGRLAVAQDRFDPLDILRQCAALARHIAEKAGIVISLRIDVAPSVQLRGDAAKLRQAISGLVHNAIKFTPEGGRVSISAVRKDSALIIQVADTGIGMTSEDVAVVTRPFHRLRSALDGLQQGAGLGLPFAKTVVELHGGALRISSVPGEGTRISVTLPLEAANAQAA